MTAIDTFIKKIEQIKTQGDYEGALKLTLEALNEHMNDYRLYEELADIYIYQENLEKAEEVIGYARELHPTSGTGIFLEGYIAIEKGDFEKAISILENANTLFPNNAEVLQHIGWSHVMLGNMQKGIALLHRARLLAPDDKHIESKFATAKLLGEGEENTFSILE